MHVLVYEATGLDGAKRTFWELWRGTDSQCDFLEVCGKWVICELGEIDKSKFPIQAYENKTLTKSIDELERAMIEKALEENSTITGAYQSIGVSQKSFYNKMEKLGIYDDWATRNRRTNERIKIKRNGKCQ